MFGRSRKLERAVWTNLPELLLLARTCDGQHIHVTSAGAVADARIQTETDESTCNRNLSSAWAECVSDFAKRRGLRSEPNVLVDVLPSHSRQCALVNKAILGNLPRGKAIPPLMTDFLVSREHVLPPMMSLRELTPGCRLPDSEFFPAGTRLLRFVVDGGVEVCSSKSGDQCMAVLGIPRNPLDFLAEACKLVHPSMQKLRLSPMISAAIDVQLRGGGALLQQRRAAWARDALKLIKELAGDERLLRDEMPVHVQRIMSRKRLLFLQTLLKRSQYPDEQIAMEMASGFPLYGWLTASSVFPKKVRPPTLHESVLKAMAPSITARTMATIKESADPEVDQKLWDATLKEVEEGFLQGPFLPGELGAGAIVSPRFGVTQKSKLRPIDNFSASMVNRAVGLPEKLKVEAIDEVAAVIKEWLRRTGRGCKLVGKTYDLRKAYRQLPIKEDGLHAAWIAVWSPKDAQPRVFRMESLPFGATASVASFLRAAEAIKYIGCHELAFVWTIFFDDFIVVCNEEDADETHRAVQLLFRMLGWELSTDPEKNAPFASSFSALGVVIDLRGSADGFFTISNTERRKCELVERIDAVLEAQSLRPWEAKSLRSRLLFAEAQIFGRTAKLALSELGKVEDSLDWSVGLSSSLEHSLYWLKKHVAEAPPRRVEVQDKPTFLLFLDGACEGGEGQQASIGAVLCDQSGRGIACFGEQLPDDILGMWRQRNIKQLIFQAETMPYLVALFLWHDVLKNACVLVFIDNEAARFAWISGSAHAEDVSRMLRRGAFKESAMNTVPYFCRVPTHSNIADGPSKPPAQVVFVCSS